MSYMPTEWKAGDTVTSAKLNKMEQGIAGGANILIVGEITEDGVITLDKTWQEIFDAGMSFIVEVEENFKVFDPVMQVNVDEDKYFIRTGSSGFIAQTADDYPVYNEGNIK